MTESLVPPMPIPTAPAVPSPVPMLTPTSKKFPTVLVAILSIITVFAVAFSVFALLQIQSMQKQLAAKPSPTPAASVDPTANWKTYTDSKLGFTFKYPNEYNAQVSSINGHADPSRIDFGTDTGSFLTVLTGKLPSYNEKNMCTHDTKILPCISADTSRGTSSIAEITLGGKKAKSLYVSEGTVDSDYHVILTEESPKIELRMYISGGGLDQTFSQILSTFKFTNCTKNQELNMTLDLPSGWQCAANVDEATIGGMTIKGIGLKSDFFNVEIADGGRGPYCGDGGDPENLCKTSPLILSNRFQLTVYNYKGEDKEIFGNLGQTSNGANRWIAITYQNMETTKLTDAQKQDLLQLLNSITFSN